MSDIIIKENELVKEDEITKEVERRTKKYGIAIFILAIAVPIMFFVFAFNSNHLALAGQSHFYYPAEDIAEGNLALFLLVTLCILFLMLLYYIIMNVIYSKKGVQILLKNNINKMKKQVSEKSNLDMLKAQKAELEKKIAEYESH